MEKRKTKLNTVPQPHPQDLIFGPRIHIDKALSSGIFNILITPMPYRAQQIMKVVSFEECVSRTVKLAVYSSLLKTHIT